MAQPTRDSRSIRPPSARPLFIGLSIVLGLALPILVAVSPPERVYDEQYYLAAASEFATRTSLREFLQTPTPTAPGPLYCWLHGELIGDATGVRVHRAVNLGMLGVSILAVAWVLRRIGAPIGLAGMALAIPLAWPVGVMALTEAPAIMFVSLAVACLVAVEVGPDPVPRVRSVALYASAGLATASAILTRQTCLPLLALPVVFFVGRPGRMLPTLAYFVCALPLPAALFLTWGGLTPPGLAHISGISLPHGALALAYLGFMMVFVAPGWFASRRWCLAAAVLAAAVVGLGGLEWQSLGGIARRLPEWVQPYFRRVCAMLLTSVAVGFGISAIHNVVVYRADRIFVAAVTLGCALAGTAVGVVHQFSSRYVALSLPFILIMAGPFFRMGAWACVRLATGALIGCASALSYLYH